MSPRKMRDSDIEHARGRDAVGETKGARERSRSVPLVEAGARVSGPGMGDSDEVGFDGVFRVMMVGDELVAKCGVKAVVHLGLARHDPTVVAARIADDEPGRVGVELSAGLDDEIRQFERPEGRDFPSGGFLREPRGAFLRERLDRAFERVLVVREVNVHRPIARAFCVNLASVVSAALERRRHHANHEPRSHHLRHVNRANRLQRRTFRADTAHCVSALQQGCKKLR
eukprot:CAMPEP_0197395378 /NCGR_PEP_ID=MMETSP1165-20131217/6912_1 /TAXON_ID=284809 /ORGANISM="Chrysocystis fragilis, Strain CCMP3189" /LENGTH=227 /DNA_ID=CAMNT_0042921137 /DNA_START=51 /DNA_END=730 /DNA_ORIENTATION=+